MYRMRNAYKILAGELTRKRPGTPRCKWDNPKMDI
jgi:hypothetical protein